jgi:gliding motility-associated-like protein
VKDNNNIEFDELFRQQLGNASAPVPGGVWEGVSSSIGSSAGVATAAVKTALWMKAVIAVSVIGVVAAVTYQVVGNKETKAVQNPEVVQPVAPLDVQNEVNEEKDVMPDEATVTSKEDISSAQPSRKELPALTGSRKQASLLKIEHTQTLQPELRFIETKPEISVDYLSRMNEQAVPGFDSSKIEKRDSETQEDEPYIPEKEPVAMVIDSSYIYIPNVVTPNGDGINDGYLIDIKGEEFVQIIIYNNKSVKVFETRNKSTAWNCTLPNGETAPEGNYIVRVIYKFKNKPKSTTTTNLKLIK